MNEIIFYDFELPSGRQWAFVKDKLVDYNHQSQFSRPSIEDVQELVTHTRVLSISRSNESVSFLIMKKSGGVFRYDLDKNGFWLSCEGNTNPRYAFVKKQGLEISTESESCLMTLVLVK